MAAEVDAFIDMVEDAWGTEILVYVDHRWESRYPVKERLSRDLWPLRFQLRPTEDWRIWQIQAFARVDGVDGGVLLSAMSGVGFSCAFRAAARSRTREAVRIRKSPSSTSAAQRTIWIAFYA